MKQGIHLIPISSLSRLRGTGIRSLEIYSRGRYRARVAMLLFLCATVAGGGVWAALQSTTPSPVSLASMLPQGALLTIEAKDFSGLLKTWNDSPEKAAWLKSDNYSVFSQSRLFGRLGDAQGEFAHAAGMTPDMSFLEEIAGGQSIFAWYDIGNLEFLYITRMPSTDADKGRLLSMRGKFSLRQVGSQTFYVKTETSQSQPRTVAFATSGDWLLLSTREDLMANALSLLADSTKSSSTSQPSSLAAEQWFVDAHAALKEEPGALRMTLDLHRIVPSPYFRSYWIERNVTEMKRYRSAVADLYLDKGAFREERVLLPSDAAQAVDRPSSGEPDLESMTALLPQHAQVYRVTAQPSVNTVVGTLNDKLLQRQTGTVSSSNMAPSVDLTVGNVGSASDLETRIDTVASSAPTKEFDLTALHGALEEAGINAMMSVDRTGQPIAGVYVPLESAVLLSADKAWSMQQLQAALEQPMRGQLTAGGIGLDWKTIHIPEGDYFTMGEARPLEIAVLGRLCLISDSPSMMSDMLGRMHRSTFQDAQAKNSPAMLEKPGSETRPTLIAEFNLNEAIKPYTQWTMTVDHAHSVLGSSITAGQDSRGLDIQANGVEPAFFANNIRSLADTFSALDNERLVERRDGALTRQTVTYSWRR